MRRLIRFGFRVLHPQEWPWYWCAVAQPRRWLQVHMRLQPLPAGAGLARWSGCAWRVIEQC